MSRQMPEQALENSNKSSRSLGGFALGATEFIFLLGLVLLAAGLWLVWDVVGVLLGVGGVLVVTAWLMQFAE